MTPRPHIIVVVADSLRADTVECVPGVLPTLTSRGVQFTAARSAGCWTAPATASLFTGCMPHEHGVETRSRHGLPTDMPTLAELLKGHGYATHMITANTATTGFGLSRGFDRVWRAWEGLERRHGLAALLLPLAGRKRIREQLFDGNYVLRELSKDLRSSMVWLQDTADDVFAEGLRTLADHRARNEPCFLFMNLMEAHFPYHVDGHVVATSRNPFTALREYLALLRLVTQSWLPRGDMTIDDDMLLRLRQRQVLAWQRLAPRLDAFVEEVDAARDTIIVFLSDHGDCFGEDGMAYHFGNVTDAGNRVPLFWVHPELGPGAVTTPVSTRDLFGTLLVEVDHPSGDMHLVDAPQESLVVMQAHWYDHNGKTHPRYRVDQFACIVNGIPWMHRNGCWHRASLASDTKVWRDGQQLYSPIEDGEMDKATRRELRHAFQGFVDFSRAHS